MSVYIVQAGDTPMVIAQKLIGNAARVGELVRANAHKPAVVSGGVLTFRELYAGEQLTVPPTWVAGAGLGARHKQGHVRKPMNPHTTNRGVGSGVSGHSYPQPAPQFAVRPRAGSDGGGDDSGHGAEPILTIVGHRGVPAAQRVGEGVGKDPCCNSCASGGPCEGCEGATCAV